MALVAEQLGGAASIGDLYSPTLLAVGCHDLGQVVVAHPRGWQLLGPDAKRHLMSAMTSADEGVQRAALCAHFEPPKPTAFLCSCSKGEADMYEV